MRHIEEDIQMACVKWFDYTYPKLSKLLHHSPNGGKRNVREAARFKRMGVRAGFPDLILLYPVKMFNCLCIEMKSDKGTQTINQMEWAELVKRAGA